MDWTEFYADRVGSTTYYLHFITKYGPFLDKIVDALPPCMYGVGEFGCGIGNTTKFLIEAGLPHHHYCYDIDQDMLYLAKQNIKLQNKKCLYREWDITRAMPPRKYDLIHSHGVLEHFRDVEIQSIIYHQLNMTDTVVHYVPGQYESPSFGDERLMSPEQWRSILSDYNVTVESFNENDILIYS